LDSQLKRLLWGEVRFDNGRIVDMRKNVEFKAECDLAKVTFEESADKLAEESPVLGKLIPGWHQEHGEK
jgi:hypothetical protein